jgi:signal transduction histidine kinase
MLASLCALALAAIGFLAYDVLTFQRTLVGQLAVDAAIVGTNAADALLRRDQRALDRALSALRADSRVLRAAVYDRDRRRVATYVGPAGAGAALPEALASPILEAHRFERERVIVLQPVENGTGVIGGVLVESNLGELSARVRQYLVIAFAVLLISLLVALALSAWLQRRISEPILQLVDMARRVSEDRDYSVRAPARTGDELGLLVGAINEMLAQIQKRDDDLERARHELEKRIEERTREVGDRERAQQELERSNADLEQFAYVASHDLQEPLRMIGSYIELLARRYRGKLDADADDFIQYAVDGVARMQELIDDLLSYSRVGRRGKELVPTEVAEAFEEATANLRTAIDESSATITADALPSVRGDASQLAQLFQNLLGNAIKFRGDAAPRIHVSAVRQDGDWAFSVSDNGIGLDPRHADRIFVMFQRLHSREEYAGTGIGLAICKRIVERHGGHIRAESEGAGKGTAFHFTLKAAKDGEA